MADKKSQNKDLKGISKKKKPEEDSEFDEYVLPEEGSANEEFTGEKNSRVINEDDDEFILQVEEFEKNHAKGKIINIFNRIGKPKFIEYGKLDKTAIKDELKRLILLLDKYNIIVHFHNDYPEREKYRFITEEIFREFAEYDKKNNHITFLYEDYHPEMADDEDDEEF
ncbi:MAG: hypothetical protein WBQ38_06850 [Ignavibacteria bacterium]|jgi:hypothetical protein|nr:hypothetical protein [Ignavibacteria bacterium]MBK8383459.1 hypothetical protein [Ignavibacteria bacterium]MBK9403284.1 hypothetical protein [Ignavibacteria bacterium]